jgi:succinate dehydrogenase hydrophobic anchor subunit
MKATPKKARFISVPSWALSLLAVILILVIVGILNGFVKSISDNMRYMIWATLTVIACFFICWNKPKSFWYVPLLCNIIVPLAAIGDNTFWTTPLGLIMFIGLCLSFVAGFIGAKIGQRAVKQDTISKESRMK